MSLNHPSYTWVNPKILFVCSFVLFPPTPLIVFLVAWKKCAIPYRNHLMITGQEVKWWRSWCNGELRGYCHTWTKMHLTFGCFSLEYFDWIFCHHHEIVPIAPLSLTLSLSLDPSLLSIAPGMSSRLHPLSPQSWSTNPDVSMRWSPSDKVDYKFVLTSSEVPCIPCSSYMDVLWDGRLVVVQLLFCRL